jgi:hypothetical protein
MVVTCGCREADPPTDLRGRTGTSSATATIVFDDNALVDGAANCPFPAPFIRVDTEK